MRIPLRQYGDVLADYLRPEWPKVVLLAFLLLSSIGLQLLNPQVLRGFIDATLAKAAPETLTGYAVSFIAIALLNQGLTVAATYVGQDVGWRATNRLREDLATHCLGLDLPFFHERTPGELIERIDGDVTALSDFFSQLVIRVFGSVLLLIGTLIVLFHEDWRVGLALAGFCLVALIVLNRSRDFAVPYQKAERQASAELFGFLEERLAGLGDVRANGAAAYTMRRFYERSYDLFVKGRKALMMRSITWLLAMGLFTVGNAMTLGLGAYLYFAGVITLGTVYLFFQYTDMLQRPLEQISNQLQELQRAAASVVRVQELLQIRSRVADGPGAPIPGGALEVEFDQVTFAYADEEDDEPVLRDLSFKLRPGRVLGLLGRTGSGKTTVSRLLFRFYDPSRGAIRLGGVEARMARLADLRKRVAVVTQDVQLFSATARDNLTFFDDSIPDERILAVIHELGLDGWLEKLPSGLDTLLQSGGSGLSAGEAQLLAFVRVFLRDPGLVILDEASSRLDPATERLIERAVGRLLHNRTGVIIAHRLGTVQRADEIMVLESGRISEHGVRVALAGDPTTRFAQLLRTGMEEALV